MVRPKGGHRTVPPSKYATGYRSLCSNRDPACQGPRTGKRRPCRQLTGTVQWNFEAGCGRGCCSSFNTRRQLQQPPDRSPSYPIRPTASHECTSHDPFFAVPRMKNLAPHRLCRLHGQTIHCSASGPL